MKDKMIDPKSKIQMHVTVDGAATIVDFKSVLENTDEAFETFGEQFLSLILDFQRPMMDYHTQ